MTAYYALTRPMGECYFATAPSSLYHPGAAIHMATSHDLFIGNQVITLFSAQERSSLSNVKIGGGTPPILTDQGWLMLYHGVENKSEVGIYRTFWALLDKYNPYEILHLEDTVPLLEADPGLTENISRQIYLNDIVFTTGIVTHDDRFYNCFR